MRWISGWVQWILTVGSLVSGWKPGGRREDLHLQSSAIQFVVVVTVLWIPARGLE